MSAVHLETAGGRARCNRDGMRGQFPGSTVGALRKTTHPPLVTCADCKRLHGLDQTR